MNLTAKKRAEETKGKTKQIRRDGNIPAVFYSPGNPAQSIEVDGAQFGAALRKIKTGCLGTTVFTLEIDGKKAQGIVIQLPEAPMVLALGRTGYLICGYMNLEMGEKFGAVCAVVRGVRTVDDILKGAVASVSTKARELGVTEGMTGREALSKFL